jgi:hypothetical protein
MVTVEYRFVINTNRYAGNFEREMCAYITGQVGECGVGSSLAGEFNAEEGADLADEFERIIKFKMDDVGCSRPVSLSNVDSNNLEIYFEERPKEEILVVMKRRAKEFCKKNNIEIKNFRLFKEVTTSELLEIGLDEF